MKAIISIALAAVICAGGLLFYLSQMKRKPVETGELAQGIAVLINRWTLDRAGLQDRVLNIVLDDASKGDDPLALPEAPSAWDSFAASLKGLFGGKGAPEPTAFAKALKAEPDTVVWTFDGFSTSDEPRMMKAVMEAIAKANEAKAQVNIVAMGDSAAVALKGIANLEGSASAGAEIGVEKMTAIGMNEDRLRKLDPAFFGNFKRPRNLKEWANLWADRKSLPPTMPITFYSSEAPGVRYYYGNDLFKPETVKALLGAPGGTAFISATNQFAKEVSNLTRAVQSLHEALSRSVQAGKAREQNAQASAKPVEQVFRAIDGQMKTKVMGGDAAPAAAPPQDSMGMILGGGEYKGAGASGESAKEEPGQSSWEKTSSQSSLAENRKRDQACSKCCADVGGSWRYGSYDDNDLVDDRRYGCCDGADYNVDVDSCRAARRVGGLRGGGYDKFRCAGSGAR